MISALLILHRGKTQDDSREPASEFQHVLHIPSSFHHEQVSSVFYIAHLKTASTAEQTKTSQVTYVTMVPRVGNETLRPLGVATGNASSVTRV